MSDRSKRYRAFISYSQKDKSFARRLHQALEGYRLPSGVEVEGVDPKARKLGRLFRDDDEMGAATDLGTALQGAIADAENLIVVCSPNAAKSRWVNEEVIHFKRTGRADRIFAVIVGGDPTSSEEQCFPPGLRFELDANGALSSRPAEPLGLDVRKEPFNRLVVRLVAGLVRTPFDTLWKRERRRAHARTLVVLLAALFLTVAVGATVTQSLWRPAVEAYWRYERFARQNSGAALGSAAVGTTFQDCRSGSTDCPTMVIIPEGRFIMGSPLVDAENSEGEESPQREISLGRFAASTREVTFAEYRRCFDAGACGNEMPRRDGHESMGDRDGWDNEQRPVTGVSWEDAHNYVSWLSRNTGQEYRLLTEAEWEYAARAQNGADRPSTRFSWGNDDPVCQVGAPNGAAVQCHDDWADTWPVGSFPANAFGLHDMHGNVSEWVEDCHRAYDATKLDGSAIVADASGFPCSPISIGVLRGGSFLSTIPEVRSANRGWQVRNFRLHYVGFRVARSI